jgi:S-formylglutathione hydrolase FrmB
VTRRGGRLRLGALALSVAAAVLAPTAAAAAAPTAAAADAGEPAGLRTLSIRSLEPRLQEATIATAAVPGGRTRVRVLLPRGYDRTSRRRYPVLYLLHGALGNERTYTDDRGFGLRGYTAKLPLIVVMPDSGQGGGYVNWWNFGRGGPPQWETYHVRQLIPWVDAHYRTRSTRAGRAVAGLSMGGDGAIKYAAKHPDLFVAAHAFSGAVDLNVLAPALRPGPHLGPYDTQEVRWRGNNPWDLAENLRGVELALRTGNGEADGPYGDNDIWPGGLDPVEAGVHVANVSLHDRLEALGIHHIWDDYGPGAHTVPYWNRDLRLSLPVLMRTFRQPPPRPRLIGLRAIEPRYSVYGWDVRLRRKALEFSRLSGAGKAGFTLTGSGSATVRTPALYDAGASYAITTRRSGATRRTTVTADRRGRLRIALRLGPANRLQQFTPEERQTPSRFHRVTVTVAPER